MGCRMPATLKFSETEYILLRGLSILVLPMVLVLAVACAPVIDHRGQLPDEDALAQLIPGKQTRRDVAALLGSPSSVTMFEDERWLYISNQIKRRAFLAPEEIDRTVIELRFSRAGILQAVRTLSMGDGMPIQRAQGITPAPEDRERSLGELVGGLLPGT